MKPRICPTCKKEESTGYNENGEVHFSLHPGFYYEVGLKCDDCIEEIESSLVCKECKRHGGEHFIEDDDPAYEDDGGGYWETISFKTHIYEMYRMGHYKIKNDKYANCDDCLSEIEYREKRQRQDDYETGLEYSHGLF